MNYSRESLDMLLQQASIVDYLEDLGYDFIAGSNGWLNTNCPLPNHEDSSPSFGVNINSNKYNCFGCGAKGDIIQLVKEVEGLNFAESILRLSDKFGLVLEENTGIDSQKFIVPLQQDPIFSDYLKVDKSYKFPGGLNVIQFLLHMSTRYKKFARQHDNSEEVWKFLDSIYKQIDYHIEHEEYKQIYKIHKNFKNLCDEWVANNKKCAII